MTSPGETLSLSVPSIELNPQDEQLSKNLLDTIHDLGRKALDYIKTSKVTRSALALGLAVSAGATVGVAGEMGEANPPAASAVDFVNDYPHMDAQLHSAATYDWWIDEDGDKQKDLPGELKSEREFYYRNCTDGAAYWAGKYTGITPPGSWGNAATWDDNAGSYTVKSGNANNIEAGDIAQSDDGTYGHVGFVTATEKDASGNVSKITVAELNRGGDGEFTHVEYANKNSTGKFIRPGTNRDWDHYIDLNGAGKGLNNEVLSPGTSTTPPLDTRVPVAANFDGLNGEDLLGSAKRWTPDITPNLLVFPSTGSWLGANQLWSTPTGINQQEARLTAGDLDGDGKDDLFAIQNRPDGHPNIYWIKSQGSSFAAPELVGVPGLWFKDVKEWVSGDYNGDGHADLLAVSKRGEPNEDPAPNLVVFPSTGDWLGGSQLWGAPLSLKFADMKVIPADVDNDGKTDLLSVQPTSSDANANPQIWWSRSTGSGFETPQLVGVPPMLSSGVNNWIAGNFDGQPGDDLLASSKRGHPDTAPNLVIFRSTGNWMGGLELWGAPGQINWEKAKMVPADLDGDGKTDILSIQSNGTNPEIWWSRSTGSSFATPQVVGVPNLVADDVHWQS